MSVGLWLRLSLLLLLAAIHVCESERLRRIAAGVAASPSLLLLLLLHRPLHKVVIVLTTSSPLLLLIIGATLSNVVAVAGVRLLVGELLVDQVKLGSNIFNLIVGLNVVVAAVVNELLAVLFIALVVVFLLDVHAGTSLVASQSVEPVASAIGCLFVLLAAANKFLLCAHTLSWTNHL